MRKMTQTEFIDKVESRTRRPVTLSSFVYVNNSTKGTAICPTHGAFQITPNALMNGIGCPKCALEDRANKRRLTNEQFVEQARLVHGNRYDYANVRYISAVKKVEIVCRVHGAFMQTAGSHLSGKGCRKCWDESNAVSMRSGQSEFIEKCISVHGDRYDLSKIVYTRSKDKIEVLCKEHGAFFPTAGNFIHRKSGCPICARASTGKQSRKPISYYAVKGAIKHSGKFRYKGLIYKNESAYLRLVCPKHGEFLQLASDHTKGIGCDKCARPVFDTESFIEQARLVHGDRYDYSKAIYVSAYEKVAIVCKEHGEFWQGPTYHVNNSTGCPRCARVGPSKGAT